MGSINGLHSMNNFCWISLCLTSAWSELDIPLTDKGLLILKQLFEGIQEVEIRKEKNHIFIVPLVSDDAILQFGQSPIFEETDDASEHHDHYIQANIDLRMSDLS